VREPGRNEAGPMHGVLAMHKWSDGVSRSMMVNRRMIWEEERVK